MKFEDALKAMRNGKKVISKARVYPLFIADYTNSFDKTYKAICFNDSMGNIIDSLIDHNDIFAEDWEVVDDRTKYKQVRKDER